MRGQKKNEQRGTYLQIARITEIHVKEESLERITIDTNSEKRNYILY